MQTSNMALPHVSQRFGSKGSTVTVTVQGAGNATLFSDAAGTVALANPITVLANGYVDFYVAAGTYVLTEAGNGTDKRTITVTDPTADPGSVVSSSVLSTSYAMTVAFAAIPNWQIVVPANSGTVDVEVAEPMLININTGTNAAGTKFSLQMRITDEAGAVVAYAQKAIYSSAAVAQVWADVISLKKQVANNPAIKTYKVEALMDHAGVAGGASTLFTSQSGFTDPVLRAVRR